MTAFLSTSPTEARDIPTGVALARRRRTRSAPWARRFAAAFVIVVVTLAPFPAAGNLPLSWSFWTMIIGSIATLLSIWSTFGRESLNIANRRLLLLGIAFVSFAVFQALPLPGFGGDILLNLPNVSVTTAHLSITPKATWLAGFRITGYLIFFLIVLFSARDLRQAKTTGLLLFYVVVVHGLFSLISLFLLGDHGLIGTKTAFFGTATGVFVNKNSFATFLGMGFILGLAIALGQHSRTRGMAMWQQSSTLMGLAIILVALLMTQSRMGIAASLAATALLILNSNASQMAKITICVLGTLVALALIPILLQSSFFDISVSAQTRLELYRQICTMIAHRPLLGFGIDSFPLAFEPFHRAPLTAEFVWDKGHSTYLTLWAEAGVIFGSLPPLAGILAAQNLWRRAHDAKPGQSMALAGVSVMLLVGLHSLVDFSLEIHANLVFLIAIIALGLGNQPTRKGIR